MSLRLGRNSRLAAVGTQGMKTHVGEYLDKFGNHPLGIETFNHTFVDGVSGAGKSTFTEDVIIQEIRAGNPIIFIDPHGPSARRILKNIPKHFSERVVYFNPLAKKVPGLNFFYSTSPEERHKQVANFISIIKAKAESNYGPETEHVIENAATAVVEQVQNPTVLHVWLFIIRELYRASLISESDNQILKDFAHQFDDQLRTSERMSKFSPALNKLAPFMRPIARTIFAQHETLDLIKLMDEGAIIIIDLDKGKIGDVTAALIGSAILSYIQTKMFERKAEGRKEVIIFVDEFQTFGHGVNWTTFFGEGRKYDVRFWLITQSITQVPQQWITPILTNCNNLICFAVGAEDAERMAKEFGDKDLERSLIFMDDRTFYGKIKDGLHRFLYKDVKVYPPIEKIGNESYWKDVIKTSRMRHGKNRKELDAAILKELETLAPDKKK